MEDPHGADIPPVAVDGVVDPREPLHVDLPMRLPVPAFAFEAWNDSLADGASCFCVSQSICDHLAVLHSKKCYIAPLHDCQQLVASCQPDSKTTARVYEGRLIGAVALLSGAAVTAASLSSNTEKLQ